jgi:membrane-bound metal-dependent hydrolase YbcI (DUF457 family)
MDTLSHALWGRGLFGNRGLAKSALFFGAMPDLFSFGIIFIIRIFSGDFTPGAPPLETIPDWVFINYNISHSFISAFIAIGIVCLYRKDIAFAMLAWPFHIVLDFPFHTKEYFPTQIFWPLSDFYVDGIPWNIPEVWFPNVAGIILLFIYRYTINKETV